MHIFFISIAHTDTYILYAILKNMHTCVCSHILKRKKKKEERKDEIKNRNKKERKRVRP